MIVSIKSNSEVLDATCCIIIFVQKLFVCDAFYKKYLNSSFDIDHRSGERALLFSAEIGR